MESQSREDSWQVACELLESRDYSSAYHAFKVLAEDGDPLAMTEVGRMFESGLPGVPTDYNEAALWYQKAVEHGDLEGMLGYARLLLLGRGEEKDYSGARVVYEEIVEQIEEPRALFFLGQIYQFGLGVEKDEVAAIQFYRRATKSGHLLAPKFSAHIYWHNGRCFISLLMWFWAMTRIVWSGLFKKYDPNLYYVA